MSDYQHNDFVSKLVIEGESPIGKIVPEHPKKPLEAQFLCKVIDDAIANKFSVYGGLYLSNFAIEGVVNLCNREITFPIYFEHCVFDSLVEIWCSELKTLGLDGSTLERGADMRSSTIKGGLFLRNYFKCNGPLLLRDIEVSQSIDIQKATLFIPTETTESHGVNVDGECLSLSRAKAAALYLRNLTEKPRGIMNFRDAHVESFQNDIEEDPELKSWPADEALILEGFECKTMTDISPSTALRWLGLQKDVTISSLTNIAKIFKSQNRNHDYNQIVSEIRKKEISQIESRLTRYIYEMFFFLISYGTSPRRALIALVCAILIHLSLMLTISYQSTVQPSISETLSDPCYLGSSSQCAEDKLESYRQIKVSLNGKITHRYVPQQYPEFSPVLYTSESFLPFLNTGQNRYWEIGNLFLRILLAFLPPIAFFLSGLFLGNITGFLDKKL